MIIGDNAHVVNLAKDINSILIRKTVLLLLLIIIDLYSAVRS